MEPLKGGSTVAVVVTRHRTDLLRESLRAIARQTRGVDHIIVVDNGPDASSRSALDGIDRPCLWIPSWTNLGGAGGFALGILHALALGADWIWLADDDGRPSDSETLAQLHEDAVTHDLSVIAPVMVETGHPDRLAFPIRQGTRWTTARNALAAKAEDGVLRGFAALFNGVLLKAEAIQRLGVPDYRLFIRGDEVEYGRRLARSGLSFGTSVRAAYEHPSGSSDYKSFLGGLLSAQDPGDPVKRYYTYRNRGYLMTQRGRRLRGQLDIVRHSIYFAFSRRDAAALRTYLSLIRLGRREHFAPPP